MSEGKQLQKQKIDQLDYLLLDGSSSMGNMNPGTKWIESCKAIDAYIAGLKAEMVNSRIYLHVFASGSDTDICGFDDMISAWRPITGRLETPYGGTHLYDAVGITAIRMRDFDPECARVTIATDGADTHSRNTDVHQAKAYIDWMKAKGWPVTFIGVDFSNYEQAQMLGGSKENTVAVSKARLTDAMTNVAKKAAAHSRGAEDINFTTEEQEQFGGYLAGPSK